MRARRARYFREFSPVRVLVRPSLLLNWRGGGGGGSKHATARREEGQQKAGEHAFSKCVCVRIICSFVYGELSCECIVDARDLRRISAKALLGNTPSQ